MKTSLTKTSKRRRPQKNEKNEDDLKKNEKNEDDLKKN